MEVLQGSCHTTSLESRSNSSSSSLLCISCSKRTPQQSILDLNSMIGMLGGDVPAGPLLAVLCRVSRATASMATALCPSLRTQPGSVSSQIACARQSRTTLRPTRCWSGDTVSKAHSRQRHQQQGAQQAAAPAAQQQAAARAARAAHSRAVAGAVHCSAAVSGQHGGSGQKDAQTIRAGTLHLAASLLHN